MTIAVTLELIKIKYGEVAGVKITAYLDRTGAPRKTDSILNGLKLKHKVYDK